MDTLISQKVVPLATWFANSGLVRLRVAATGVTIELRRAGLGAAAPPSEHLETGPLRGEPAGPFDVITADVVGTLRLGRPQPLEGTVLGEDTELAFVEALGIRNPVRSRGPGRIVSIAVGDGEPVDFGKPLFLIDRDI